MSYKLMIVALVAIVSVQQLVLAKDIYQFCSQFDGELKKAVGGATDRDVNYNKAQELLLKTDSPLDSRLRQQLAVSWEAIKLNKGANCDAYGDKSVALFHECRPLEFEHLKVTLGADVQEFTEMCSCADLWEPKLELALKKLRSTSLAKVNTFLDTAFIERYGEDVGKTKGVPDFRLATSNNHIDPALAGTVGLNSLVKMYKTKYEKSDWFTEFAGKQNKVNAYVKSWLLKPCAKYVKAVGPVMDSAIDHAQLYGKGEDEFFAKQTESFKDSMFRYEFCRKLSLDLVRDSFLKAIFNKL